MKLGSFKLHAAFLAAALCLFANPAFAQSAALSYVSEPGDWVGQGQSLSFGTADITSQASSDNRLIGVSVNNANHWYTLNLQAPAGQQLAVGVYNGATRYPFNAATEPGLSFTGDGRGCNTLTGTFEILELKFGSSGYIEKLHATWEQHCEGGDPALFGEVSISNPPQNPPLVVTLTVDPNALFDRKSGRVTVTGSLSCSKTIAGNTQLHAELSQALPNGKVAYGAGNAFAQCSPTPRQWSSVLVSNTGSSYRPGAAGVIVNTSVIDPDTGMNVREEVNSVINVVR